MTVITLSAADASEAFKQVNIHKATGPDGLLRNFKFLSIHITNNITLSKHTKTVRLKRLGMGPQIHAKPVNIHKATGPDGLPGRVFRPCTDQLANVFTHIFNMSLTESVIPTCFMKTTIVPKNTKLPCLNDYLPIALTSVAMKCFERLKTLIPETQDPLQKAYRANRSIDDAISIALHTALNPPGQKEHLCENAIH
jgi:hypothetical protein